MRLTTVPALYHECGLRLGGHSLGRPVLFSFASWGAPGGKPAREVFGGVLRGQSGMGGDRGAVLAGRLTPHRKRGPLEPVVPVQWGKVSGTVGDRAIHTGGGLPPGQKGATKY